MLKNHCHACVSSVWPVQIHPGVAISCDKRSLHSIYSTKWRKKSPSGPCVKTSCENSQTRAARTRFLCFGVNLTETFERPTVLLRRVTATATIRRRLSLQHKALKSSVSSNLGGEPLANIFVVLTNSRQTSSVSTNTCTA